MAWSRDKFPARASANFARKRTLDRPRSGRLELSQNHYPPPSELPAAGALVEVELSRGESPRSAPRPPDRPGRRLSAEPGPALPATARLDGPPERQRHRAGQSIRPPAAPPYGPPWSVTVEAIAPADGPPLDQDPTRARAEPSLAAG